MVAPSLFNAIHIPIETRVLVLVCKSHVWHDRRDEESQRRRDFALTWHHSAICFTTIEERCRNAAAGQVRAHRQVPALATTGKHRCYEYASVLITNGSIPDVHLRRIHGAFIHAAGIQERRRQLYGNDECVNAAEESLQSSGFV